MSPTLASVMGSLPAGIAGGGATVAVFFFFKFLFEWFSGRIDAREAVVELGHARIDAATARLIENLERGMETMSARVEQLEHDLAECERRDREREAEMIRMRAVMLGLVPKRRNAGIEKARRKLDEGDKQ